MNHGAIGDNGYLSTIPEQFTFSDFEQFRFAGDVCSNTVPSRVSHGRGSVMLKHGEHHVAHLALVFWSHQDNVWHSPKICDVQKTMMRLTVAAGNAATIEAELNVQLLNTDVVNKLIKTALKEC